MDSSLKSEGQAQIERPYASVAPSGGNGSELFPPIRAFTQHLYHTPTVCPRTRASRRPMENIRSDGSSSVRNHLGTILMLMSNHAGQSATHPDDGLPNQPSWVCLPTAKPISRGDGHQDCVRMQRTKNHLLAFFHIAHMHHHRVHLRACLLDPSPNPSNVRSAVIALAVVRPVPDFRQAASYPDPTLCSLRPPPSLPVT